MPIPSLVPIAALIAAFILPTAVLAQDMPPPMDSISLTLSAEDWVEADEAKVTVGIEAAFQGVDAGSVRTEMLTVLGELAAGVDWRFIRFDRSTAASGLEQYSAMVETRLPDTALDGLADKVEDAGRAGFRLNLIDVSFTPTLAEVEAVNSDLRAAIYRMAGQELEQVNAAYPDRNFRVAAIDFYAGGEPVLAEPRVRMMEAVQAAADVFSATGGVSVSQKLVLSARLVLEAQLPE